MKTIVVVLAVLAIILFAAKMRNSEGYLPCTDCGGYRMPADGLPIRNPFIWPYSGTACVDDLYILNADSGIDMGFNSGPLTNINDPDHVEMVGH